MVISLLHGRRLCLHASILQVAILACCLVIEANSKSIQRLAQNCSQKLIQLTCPPNAVIAINAVTLAYTSTSCCDCRLVDEKCRKSPTEHHRKSIHNACNGQQSCIVTAETRWILCGWRDWGWTTSEHISFSCQFQRGDPLKPVASNSSAVNDTSAEDQSEECSDYDHANGSNITCEEDQIGFDEENTNDENDALKIIFAIAFLCIGIILVIIISVFVCRKKIQAAKFSHKIETPQYSGKYEEICINRNEAATVYHSISTEEAPNPTCEEYEEICIDRNEDATDYHPISTEEATNPTQDEPMNICKMVNRPGDSVADSIEDRIYYDLEVNEPNTEPYNTDVYEEVCEVDENLDGAVQQMKSERNFEGHSADSDPDINESKWGKNVPTFTQEVLATDGILHTTRNENSEPENMKQDFTNGKELADGLQTHAALDGDFTELTVVENDLYRM